MACDSDQVGADRIDFGATFENLEGPLGNSKSILYTLGRVSDYVRSDQLERCNSYELDALDEIEDVEECLKGMIIDLRGVANLLEDIVTNDKADVARLADMVRQAKAACNEMSDLEDEDEGKEAEDEDQSPPSDSSS